MKWIAWGSFFLTLILASNLFEYRSDCLKVVFLDVGQGDAILVSDQNGFDVLIDAGRGTKINSQLRQYMARGDEKIELGIVTHTDSDHSDGFTSVANEYKIENFLIYEESDEGLALTNMLKSHGARILKAHAGMKVDFGKGQIQVLYPFDTPNKNMSTNGNSLVLKLSTDKKSALLMGDAPVSVERLLASIYGQSIKSDILKIGHHGSRSSTAKNFVETVKPSEAVVSVGKNNSYGHPHPEVMGNLKSLDVKTLSTADMGAIEYCF